MVYSQDHIHVNNIFIDGRARVFRSINYFYINLTCFSSVEASATFSVAFE